MTLYTNFDRLHYQHLKQMSRFVSTKTGNRRPVDVSNGSQNTRKLSYSGWPSKVLHSLWHAHRCHRSRICSLCPSPRTRRCELPKAGPTTKASPAPAGIWMHSICRTVPSAHPPAVRALGSPPTRSSTLTHRGGDSSRSKNLASAFGLQRSSSLT